MESYQPRHARPEDAAEEKRLALELAHEWYDDFATVEPVTGEYLRFAKTVASLKAHKVKLENIADLEVMRHDDLQEDLTRLQLLGTKPHRLRFIIDPLYRGRYRQAEKLGRELVGMTVASVDTEVEKWDTVMTDSTGLLSRVGFATKMWQRYGLDSGRPDSVSPKTSELSEEGQQEQQKLTVANIDGARVKRVNDTLGHHMGDEFIKVLANELNDMLRGADGPLIVHYSGDEFGVVFGNISAEDLEGFERRMYESQVAKLASMRYVEAWDRIKLRRQEVLDAGQSLRIEAVDEQLPFGADQQGIRPRKMVVINGQEVVAIDEIAVMAVGVATGPADCWNDYKDLNKQAEKLMEQTKKVMHKMMPHDAELDSRPVAVG